MAPPDLDTPSQTPPNVVRVPRCERPLAPPSYAIQTVGTARDFVQDPLPTGPTGSSAKAPGAMISVYRPSSLSLLLVGVLPSLSWLDVNVDVDVAVTVASVVVPIASVLIHLGVTVLASRGSAALPSSLRTKLGPSGPPYPLPPHEPELVGGRGAGPLGGL